MQEDRRAARLRRDDHLGAFENFNVVSHVTIPDTQSDIFVQGGVDTPNDWHRHRTDLLA